MKLLVSKIEIIISEIVRYKLTKGNNLLYLFENISTSAGDSGSPVTEILKKSTPLSSRKEILALNSLSFETKKVVYSVPRIGYFLVTIFLLLTFNFKTNLAYPKNSNCII